LCCMKATFQSPLASPQMHLCHSSLPFTRRPHWTNVAPYVRCVACQSHFDPASNWVIHYATLPPFGLPY
jgi:hypothetical protein